jgi:2-keto-4-pentenoate hydratase/2-oxohepta-3-ene-1,7-dioic acid hydratase in catechol pathway
MQLCNVSGPAGTVPAVHLPRRGVLPTTRILKRDTIDVADHIANDEIADIAAALDGAESEVEPLGDQWRLDNLVTRPGKILGIGLNYPDHASDLDEQAPRTSPASFFKMPHTLLGCGEPIVIPAGIGTVTAEAELGLVIGRYCEQVTVADSLSYVAGVCAVLDQTAEDVLRQNPRYLTRTKNYRSFLALGSLLVTLDEITDRFGDLANLTVATVRNGTVHRTAPISDMTFSPAELLSFHSYVMPFHPGDVILTGTPGAIAIRPGDVVSCALGPGLDVLSAEVVGA